MYRDFNEYRDSIGRLLLASYVGDRGNSIKLFSVHKCYWEITRYELYKGGVSIEEFHTFREGLRQYNLALKEILDDYNSRG